MMENNYEYSKTLLHACQAKGIAFFICVQRFRVRRQRCV